MVVVMGFLMIVTALGAAYFSFIHQSLARAHHAELRQACENLAEAGLDKAIAELRLNPKYEGEKDTPLGMGVFSVTVTPGASSGSWQIASTGVIGATVGGELFSAYRAKVAADVTLDPVGKISKLTWRDTRAKEAL